MKAWLRRLLAIGLLVVPLVSLSGAALAGPENNQLCTRAYWGDVSQKVCVPMP